MRYNTVADMGVIKHNIELLQKQLAQTPAVSVVAVAKTFPAAAVAEAAAAGLTHFGESYLQEAEQKIAACAELPLVWHFVGAIQGNKTTRIAALFDWVHGVDRLSTARRLSAARAGRPPLNIFLQVNIDEEPTKAGIAAQDAASVAAAIGALPNLHLRGLMALPTATKDAARTADAFRRVADLQKTLVGGGIPLDCLSLGMSGDFPLALAVGATHIRLGTAIFGARPAKT